GNESFDEFDGDGLFGQRCGDELFGLAFETRDVAAAERSEQSDGILVDRSPISTKNALGPGAKARFVKPRELDDRSKILQDLRDLSRAVEFVCDEDDDACRGRAFEICLESFFVFLAKRIARSGRGDRHILYADDALPRHHRELLGGRDRTLKILRDRKAEFRFVKIA